MHIQTNLDDLLVLNRVKRTVDVKLAHVSLDIEIRQTAFNIYTVSAFLELQTSALLRFRV